MLKDIKKCLKRAYGKVQGHQAKRIDNLAKFVYAIIKSEHCSLQKIGQALPEPTDLESRISKVKRFIKNKYTDFDTFFMPHVMLLLSWLKDKEWVFIIDGSDVGKDCATLMVSIAWRKRALPICWLVRKGSKGHFSVKNHLEVIQKLASLLPDHQNPIVLLGDGEFDSPQLQDFCQAQGWKYVFKTAKNTKVSTNKSVQDTFSIGSLYPMENHQYYEAELYFTKQFFGPIHCLVWHHPSYQEPIYLVSNLEWTKDIMDYYENRFLIETMFRDIKSSGFNIHKTRLKEPERIFNLLMLVAIAFLIVAAFGAFEQQWQHFKTKFARKDRIEHLSVFQIGLRALLFCFEKQIKLFPQFSKNFFKYFCVRF